MISPARKKAQEEKAQKMYHLWAVEGKSQKEIGLLFGCTKQYVGQLIRPLMRQNTV